MALTISKLCHCDFLVNLLLSLTKFTEKYENIFNTKQLYY